MPSKKSSATKKSTKSTKNNKKKSNKALIQGFWSLSWFAKLAIVLGALLLGFVIFKICMNSYNISLLDKAEDKMRAMNLPKADKTIYRRSCSYRSVKFGGAGSPKCNIQKIDIYRSTSASDDIQMTQEYLENYVNQGFILPYGKSLDSSYINENLHKSVDSAPSIMSDSWVNGLKCNVVAMNEDKNIDPEIGSELTPGNNGYLVFSTSCSRRFMFQTYPELY